MYEKEYPYQKKEEGLRKKYRPDFYLVDYDVYVEHFGINKELKAPWLSQVEEKKYLLGMDWKRRTHKENMTKLIETYSYQFSEGTFFRELQKALSKYKIQKKEVDLETIYRKLLVESKNKSFSELQKTMSSFINLFKSNAFSMEDFDRMNKDVGDYENLFFKQRSLVFLSIIQPIYAFYQAKLEENNQIDFNDMINLATDISKKNPFLYHYKYIIVDEYQDISQSRFQLIKSIKDNTSSKVFCVGDDWQSIYRFAGSDLDLFSSFTRYFGYSELLKLQNTYRNSQQLINIASEFILKNPKQITKELKSKKSNERPIRIFRYSENIRQATEQVLIDVSKQVKDRSASILLIGRTKYDIDMLKNIPDDEEELSNQHNYQNKNRINEKQEKDSLFSFKEVKGEQTIKHKLFPNLSMKFLTAHKCKGIEDEYVIILNMTNSLLGFPNKIADDPVLHLVLTDADDYVYAEERRLFYVSLTRTKNTTYLLVPTLNRSVFATELLDNHKIVDEFLTDEKDEATYPNCPKCLSGRLILRKNTTDGSVFLSCSNYPHCVNNFKEIEILDETIECPECGGFMVKRSGKFGDFYGCTNYPICDNTYDIENTNVY